MQREKDVVSGYHLMNSLSNIKLSPVYMDFAAG